MGTGSRSLRLLIRLALILSPVASTSSSPTGSSLSVVSNIDIQKALQVKNLLTRRLYHVESGKRRRDFAKWVQQQGGPKVFSMHGINADADEEWKRLVIRKTSKDDDAQSQILEKTARRAASQTFSNQHNADTDPFPQDRMRLDIVLDEASGQTQEGRPKNMAVADVTTPKSPGILQLSLRAIVLSLHFGPVLSTLGVALLSPNFRNNYWYAWLTHCMAACGPAWIKWGQWSSTRNDMFPDALCDALARLHSDAPAHSWQVSRETLETSLCIAPNTLDTVFDDIETTPIASGSIAQVHRAILNGELVALKIRHPRVQQLMELDFRLMGVAARIFDWLSVKITGAESQIQESVKQFSHTMAAQSYLQVEAHHLEVLNDNFKSWPQVRFPFPFFASDAVIIETYEPGRIVTRMIEQYQEQAGELQVIHVEEPSTASIDLKATIAPLQLTGGDMRVKVDHPDDEQLNAKAVVVATHDEAPRTVEAYDLIPLPMAEFLVTTGLGLYLKMLLVDGVMHADLHPYVSID